MIPVLKKVITLVLFCTALVTAFSADARVKYYRYSGNLPFVEMMLEMMAAMGIIQRVPGNGLDGVYAGGGYGGLASMLSQRGLPYSGYSPYGGYSPYSGYSPYNGYSSYSGYSPYSNYSALPYSGYGGWPGTGYGSGVPLTINPLSGFPGGLSRYSSWNNPYNSAYRPYDALPFDRNLYRALNYDRYDHYDDGCYDGVCDGAYARYRNIDGLWVANNGELLGLRDGRFLWSDGSNAYTTGIIERTPVLMRAYIDDSDKQVVYRYKLIGNEMLTIDASGTLRIFRHIPVNQASAYLNRKQGETSDADGAQADPAEISGIDSGIYQDPLSNPLDYGGVNDHTDNSNWFMSSKYSD
jgi:hypothetical protein